MTAKRTSSFFQLQLGQEVIYLLLSFFALLVLLLTVLLAMQKQQLNAKEKQIVDLTGALAGLGIDAQGWLGWQENERLYLAEIKGLKETIERLRRDLAVSEHDRHFLREKYLVARTEMDKLKAEIQRQKTRIEQLELEITRLTDRPPFFDLPEADYRFDRGDNSLAPDFQRLLTNVIIPQLIEARRHHRVDVIEVVGHTDEQRVIGKESNLDTRLLPFLMGEPGEGLRACDNSGLGLARAASVARHLIKDGRLDDYAILPLSGGQVIEVGGRLSKGGPQRDAEERRRIEIRLRRR